MAKNLNEMIDRINTLNEAGHAVMAILVDGTVTFVHLADPSDPGDFGCKSSTGRCPRCRLQVTKRRAPRSPRAARQVTDTVAFASGASEA
jgi:hypothetical protein